MIMVFIKVNVDQATRSHLFFWPCTHDKSYQHPNARQGLAHLVAISSLHGVLCSMLVSLTGTNSQIISLT